MSVRRDKIQLEVEINGQKAGRTYRELVNQGRNLKRELYQLEPGTEAFIRKSTELKSVNDRLARIRAETKGVATGLKDAQGASGGFASFLKGRVLPVILATFSVGVIKNFLGNILQAGRALDDAQRKFRIVFGDAGRIVTDFAKTSASQLGVTITQYETLAARVGDILIPMGFHREEAAKLSAELVNLSGALSEWSSGQFSSTEVTEILTKALTGERESLKQLGIVIKEADVTQRLAEKGMKNLTGAALEQAKAVASLELIYEKSQDAQTAFSTNTSSLGRNLSRIGAFFRQQRENFVRSILPTLEDVAQAFADQVSGVDSLSEVMRENQGLFNIQIGTLRRAVEAGDESVLSLDNRRKLIDQINAQYGQYNDSLLTESATLEEIDKFQRQVNESFEARIKLQALREEFTGIVREQISAARDQLDIQQQITEEEARLQELIDQGRGPSRYGGRANEVLRLQRRLEVLRAEAEENAGTQEDLAQKFEDTGKAASAAGIDVDKLIQSLQGAGKTGGEGDDDPDPEEVFKQANEAIKRAFERRRLLLEQQRLQGEIDELDFQEQSLQNTEEFYNTQLSFLARFGKDQENAAIEIQNNLLQVQKDIFSSFLPEDLEGLGEDEIDELLKGLEEVNEASRKLREDSEALVASPLFDEDDIQAGIDAINREKLARIRALDELDLSEEEYQRERQRIDRETTIAILRERLALYEVGTSDYIRIVQLIADLELQIVRDTEAEKTEIRKQGVEDAKRAVGQFGGLLSNTLFDIESSRIERTRDKALEAAEAEFARKSELARGDAQKQAQAQKELDQQRKRIEEQAARRRKNIARKEAIIQGALAVIEANPNPFLIAFAIATTLTNLAVIDQQSFKKGGYTGKKKIYRDSAGDDVAGVVHTHEWVAPEWMNRDPQTRPVIQHLEHIRRTRGGYQEGGFATPSTTPVGISNVNLVRPGPGPDANRGLGDLVAEVRLLRQEVAAQRKVLRAYVVYEDIEDAAEEINEVRQNSAI